MQRLAQVFCRFDISVRITRGSVMYLSSDKFVMLHFCYVRLVMTVPYRLLWLSDGTMETGHSHATGFIAAKNLLVQMSCSGTNGHTQVCSFIVCLWLFIYDNCMYNIMCCIDFRHMISLVILVVVWSRLAKV